MDLRNPLRAITPTLDAEVLRVLAYADKAFTVPEIQRLGSGSRQGVRLVLDRLVGQGVVDVERVGRTFVFRLNREHLAAPHIAALAALRPTLIERLRAELEAWTTPPSAAAVFGSLARGEASESSDIDLLVIRPDRVDPEDEVWRGQVTELERRTSRWTGNDARVLEYSRRDFIALRHVEPVLEDATTEGILLYGSFDGSA